MKPRTLKRGALALLRVVSLLVAFAPVSLGASNSALQLQCRVIDFMPDFWRFWDAAQNQSQATQLRLFNELVVRRHPEVYNEGVLGIGSNAPDLKAQIVEFLREAPAQIPAIRQMADSLNRTLPHYVADFQHVFPDFRCGNAIYVLISLGAFDGAGRPVDGSPALLLGVDVIASVHTQEELGVFFDHELFHTYHRQKTGMPVGMGQPLYQTLWQEGLATYVSSVLNPQASESELLGRPSDLARRARPLLSKIASELLKNMDNTSPDLYHNFFLGHDTVEDFPPRSGYFVGLLVARKLSKRYSLQQLTNMKGEPLRADIRSALEALTMADNVP